MLRISSETVVLSAADSNKPIAGGNRSSAKNPFPTLGALLNDHLFALFV